MLCSKPMASRKKKSSALLHAHPLIRQKFGLGDLFFFNAEIDPVFSARATSLPTCYDCMLN